MEQPTDLSLTRQLESRYSRDFTGAAIENGHF